MLWEKRKINGWSRNIRLRAWHPNYILNTTGAFHPAKLSLCSDRRWYLTSILRFPDGSPWGAADEVDCELPLLHHHV